jgi:radical SAM protein with 4Fe4S-binding SPASM domain
MDLEKAKRIIHHYAKQEIKELYLTAEGEILLYHDLIELLKYSRNSGFKKLHLNTNGYLLDRYIDIVIENIDSVYISLDGYDSQSYEKHRGIDAYDKVISNIKSLVFARKNSNRKPQISLACVIYEEKLSSIEKMIQLAEQLQVDRLEFYNFHNPNPQEEFVGFSPIEIESNNLYDYYQKIINKNDYSLEIVLPAPLQRDKSSYFCENLFSYITIGARGDFTPCCRIPPDSKYGNIEDTSEAYQDKKIEKFKEKFSSAHSIKDLDKSCQKCQGLSPETYIYFPHERIWKKRWLVDHTISAYENLDLDREIKHTQAIDWSTVIVHNNEYEKLIDYLTNKEGVIQHQHQLLHKLQQELIEKDKLIQIQKSNNIYKWVQSLFQSTQN